MPWAQTSLVLIVRWYDRRRPARPVLPSPTVVAEPTLGAYRLRDMRHLIFGLLAAVVIATVACTTGAGPSAKGTAAITGIATAGPVCPVERPGDSACAARPVSGATIVVTTPGGAEVTRAKTGADGTFVIDLPIGDYVLVPQPVQGLMGTAPPLPISVPTAGSPVPSPFPIQYDTGIR
jgi:hypothetical protein